MNPKRAVSGSTLGAWKIFIAIGSRFATVQGIVEFAHWDGIMTDIGRLLVRMIDVRAMAMHAPGMGGGSAMTGTRCDRRWSLLHDVAN